jgi:hypothetical protein
MTHFPAAIFVSALLMLFTTACKTTPSLEVLLKSQSDQKICNMAVNFSGLWEVNHNLLKYVKEAKTRGLSNNDCQETLGRKNQLEHVGNNQIQDSLLS